MKKIIVSSQYLMPISALDLYRSADIVLLDQFEFYQKKSYRNRAHICNSYGLFRLSIPLAAGKNQALPMKEVRIANDEEWQKHHWQSIISAYNRSPYFEFYQDDLMPFYQKKYSYLLDWNIDLLNWLKTVFKFQTEIKLSEQYVEDETLDDYRNAIHPKLAKQTYLPELEPYPQVFSDRLPFQKDLSCIDLLFNKGPHY